MNYSWQYTKSNNRPSWRLDYSETLLETLSELALNETVGIGGDPLIKTSVGPPRFVGNKLVSIGRLLPQGGPVDFNRDGDSSDLLTFADINYFGGEDINKDGVITPDDERFEVLRSHNDWGYLKFNFLGTNGFADGARPEADVDEMTLRQFLDLESIGEGSGDLGFSTVIATVDEDVGSVTATVRRFGGTDGVISIDYTTVDNTAFAGADYTLTSGTLVFEEGEILQSFDIPVLDDNDPEDQEELQVRLSNPQGGASLREDLFTVLIEPSDAPGILQFAVPFFSEQEDAGTATITVNRTGGEQGAVSVDFETTDSSALEGEDYTGTSGTLIFAEGVTSQTFDILITDDILIEGNEGLLLSLSNPAGGAILGSIDEAILTILNVPTPAAQFDFAVATQRIDEEAGMATLEIIRSRVLDTAVSVDLLTYDDSATAGSDYTDSSMTLNFVVDETNKFVDIPILSDTLAEGIEDISLTLEHPSSNAVLGVLTTAKSASSMTRHTR